MICCISISTSCNCCCCRRLSVFHNEANMLCFFIVHIFARSMLWRLSWLWMPLTFNILRIWNLNYSSNEMFRIEATARPRTTNAAADRYDVSSILVASRWPTAKGKISNPLTVLVNCDLAQTRVVILTGFIAHTSI